MKESDEDPSAELEVLENQNDLRTIAKAEALDIKAEALDRH